LFEAKNVLSKIKNKLLKPFLALSNELLQSEQRMSSDLQRLNSELQRMGSELQRMGGQYTALDNKLAKLHGDFASLYFNNWASDKTVVSPILGGESQRIIDVLRRLIPNDVRSKAFRRFGRELDGGYVMIDDIGMARAAISCGIETEVSWDREMAEHGLIVHQFDHTVEGPPDRHDNYRFRKLAIRPNDSSEGITLTKIVSEIGDDAHGAILKLDIERSEWSVLAAIDPAILVNFSQILVEFHDVHYMPIFMNDAEKAVANLTTNHFVAHVHANNHEEVYSVSGVSVPRVLELTFANRKFFDPVPCTRTFPTALDRRNDPRRADIYLGGFIY
jgi:hypothetical protein